MEITYHNGWTKEKLWDYAEKHTLTSRLVYNGDLGSRREMANGDIYETRITDYIPGMYPYTESVYINGVLVQVAKH